MYYSSASRSLTDFCEVHCLRCVRVIFSTRHLAHYLTLRILICFSLSVFMLLTGCISSERTTREICLENPRSTSGILVKDSKDNTMDKLIAQFEGNWNNAISSPPTNIPIQRSNEKAAKTSVKTRGYPKSTPGLSWPTGMGKPVSGAGQLTIPGAEPLGKFSNRRSIHSCQTAHQTSG